MRASAQAKKLMDCFFLTKEDAFGMMMWGIVNGRNEANIKHQTSNNEQ